MLYDNLYDDYLVDDADTKLQGSRAKGNYVDDALFMGIDLANNEDFTAVDNDILKKGESQ